MSHAGWFLAELVLEHRIDGEPRNVVHANTVLVQADSAEEAWEKALALGRDAESVYLNTDERQVSVRFRGLRELQAIHEELGHGAELLYSERVDVRDAGGGTWTADVFFQVVPAQAAGD